MGSNKPTIILVPGAFHFPDCFDDFAQLLNSHGYKTIGIKLASVFTNKNAHRAQSHHEDAAKIRAVVEPLITQGQDLVIFAHSYGGVPTSEACHGLGKKESATGGGILHIIYCCTFILQEGESVIDVGKARPDVNRKQWTTLEEDGITARVLEEHVHDVLYTDVPAELAKNAYHKLGLMSFLTFSSPAVNCAWKQIPSTYLLTEADKAVEPQVQQYMCDRAGIMDIKRLAGAHSPFLTRPSELVAIVDEIVGRYD